MSSTPEGGWRALRRTPCTLYPRERAWKAPGTLYPVPSRERAWKAPGTCTLHPAPCTLHPAPCTLEREHGRPGRPDDERTHRGSVCGSYLLTTYYSSSCTGATRQGGGWAGWSSPVELQSSRSSECTINAQWADGALGSDMSMYTQLYAHAAAADRCQGTRYTFVPHRSMSRPKGKAVKP